MVELGSVINPCAAIFTRSLLCILRAVLGVSWLLKMARKALRRKLRSLVSLSFVELVSEGDGEGKWKLQESRSFTDPTSTAPDRWGK